MQPPHKNQVVELDVQAFGMDAVGVCRYGERGLAVFVPYALPGERIEARILKVEKRHAFARVERVIMASPQRAQAPCPVYRRCGGCAAQHMTYLATLEYKRAQVRDCLTRIGGIALDVPPVVGMTQPWHYRNKGSYPVAGEAGAPRIGFYAPRTHEVVDAPGGCPIQHPSANAAVAAVRGWMARHRIAPYDEAQHTGTVRHVVTRTVGSGQTMVVLVTREAQPSHLDALVSALREAVPGLASVMHSHHPKPGNTILGDAARLLWGESALEDTLCGARFRISPHTFFQVNRVQAEALYAQALAFAGLTGKETVLDAYCGAGTITLLLARHARRVIGIESVPQAVEDARYNAAANGVHNTEFVLGAAECVMPQLAAQGLTPDVAVVDPPRKGCDAVMLDALVRAAPKRIVYVSCNPATLARDAARLTAGGYRAVAVQPVDMFCWAGDVESVLLLEWEGAQ